jgi:tetratricopeptide (TPR) repeat protein
MSMNNLATVLRDQGKYEQVEEMLRQALRLRETVLGKEHPDTLTSISNLATVLRDQGKYEQAEEMYLQALRLREIMLVAILKFVLATSLTCPRLHCGKTFHSRNLSSPMSYPDTQNVASIIGSGIATPRPMGAYLRKN